VRTDLAEAAPSLASAKEVDMDDSTSSQRSGRRPRRRRDYDAALDGIRRDRPGLLSLIDALLDSRDAVRALGLMPGVDELLDNDALCGEVAEEIRRLDS
jgi:hypothetical protein